MSKLIRAEDVIAGLKKTYPTDRIALEHLTRIVEECEEVKMEAKEEVDSGKDKTEFINRTALDKTMKLIDTEKVSKPRRKTNANK